MSKAVKEKSKAMDAVKAGTYIRTYIRTHT